MRSEVDYPEYSQIAADRGQDVARAVGEIIMGLHARTMADIQRLAQQVGDLSMVVTLNVLHLLSMEEALLIRAIEIMRSEDGKEECDQTEFAAALEEAQRQLIEESRTEEKGSDEVQNS